MATECAAPSELKQFGFIKNASDKTVNVVASNLYFQQACGLLNTALTKSKESAMLKPTIESLESRIAPIVEKAPETASQLLVNVDTKADNCVIALKDLIAKAKSGALTAQLKEVSESSFLQGHMARVEGMEKQVFALKERGLQLPSEAVELLTTTLAATKAYLNEVVEGTTKFSQEKFDTLLKQVAAAWEQFVNHPKVKDLVEKAAPKIEAAKEAGIKTLVQLKENAYFQSYAVPSVYRLEGLISSIAGSQRYKSMVAPQVDKVLSVETQALLEKNVRDFVDSLKVEKIEADTN